MKTNAIIRIIIWSLVILVLLGILTAGLGFRGILGHRDWDDDDPPAETFIPQRIEEPQPTMDPATIFYAEKTINIHSKPSESAEIRNTAEAGDSVRMTRDEMINGQHWGYVTEPSQGWILLEENAEDTAAQPLENTFYAEEATNIRSEPDPMAEVLGMVEAGDTVQLTRDEVFDGRRWGYVLEPAEGWIWLGAPVEETTVTEPSVTEPATVADNGNTVPPSASSSVVGNGYGCNAADVSDIEIEWVAGTIRVVPTDGDRIQVTETGDFEKHPMVINKKGSKLTIKYSKETQIGFGINFDFSKDLTVEIPKEHFLRELEIDAASASVLVQDLNAGEVNFDGASGVCEFTDCNVTSLDVDTASGDITYRGTLESLECDAASASFIGVLTNVPRRIEMDSMSGNLDITLPEDAGFTVITEGLNSKFTTDFSETSCTSSHFNHGHHQDCDGKHHLHGDGACRIQMEAMNGDVIVRKG